MQFEPADERILGRLDSDFLRLASTRFLARLFEQCCGERTKTTKVIEAYCAVELSDRAEKLNHAPYEVALRIHKSDRFTFIVPGLGVSQLVTLNPDIPKLPRLLREMNKKEGASA